MRVFKDWREYYEKLKEMRTAVVNLCSKTVDQQNCNVSFRLKPTVRISFAHATGLVSVVAAAMFGRSLIGILFASLLAVAPTFMKMGSDFFSAVHSQPSLHLLEVDHNKPLIKSQESTVEPGDKPLIENQRSTVGADSAFRTTVTLTEGVLEQLTFKVAMPQLDDLLGKLKELQSLEKESIKMKMAEDQLKTWTGNKVGSLSIDEMNALLEKLNGWINNGSSPEVMKVLDAHPNVVEQYQALARSLLEL
ncbi:hypothetical protein HDU81_005320 [Chytriomyces hyalinus]|nr:hypothetical protein HDU81_005320 [Chytriomyces hyalinus]